MTSEKPGIWIIDAGGKTVFADDRMAGILGTTVSAIVGQPSFSYVFPEDLERAGKLFETKKDRDSSPFEFELRRVDGSRARVRVQGTPMHDLNGVFLGIVGTFTPLAEATLKMSSGAASKES